MTHPVFAARQSFASMALGRAPRREDARTLTLESYLFPEALPEIPEVFDYVPPLTSWPMYGNDRLGDCTCAAAGHMLEAWSALAGTLETPADSDVEAAYWATGSGDTGRVELDVLNYWRTEGIAGAKIAAYVAVDPTNHDHVRAALYLFGGLYVGLSLPLTAQAQDEWTFVQADGRGEPGSWGGHAVPYLPSWDGETIKLVTWGAVLDADVRFHDAYCEEAYAIVSPAFLAGTSGLSPEGFDVAALEHDLGLVTR